MIFFDITKEGAKACGDYRKTKKNCGQNHACMREYIIDGELIHNKIKYF